MSWLWLWGAGFDLLLLLCVECVCANVSGVLWSVQGMVFWV